MPAPLFFFFFSLFRSLVLQPALYDPSPCSRTVVHARLVLDPCCDAPRPFAKSGFAAYGTYGRCDERAQSLANRTVLIWASFAKLNQATLNARASLDAQQIDVIKNSSLACLLLVHTFPFPHPQSSVFISYTAQPHRLR
jgi:hypothetical protein